MIANFKTMHHKILSNIYDGAFCENALRLNARKNREKNLYERNTSTYSSFICRDCFSHF